MLCPNCKKEIENGSAFCEHCGTRVKKSKKGLWITLSVVFVAIIATIVVTTIQEQQEQIARKQYLAAQYQREVERQLQAERKAREEAEHQAEAQRKAKEEAERQAELARQEAARKAEAERKAELARQEAARKAEAERKAELARLGFVDLGLPSGTLWKNSNEGSGYSLYTYDEAVSRFGNKLPTKQQLEELKNKCTWTRTDRSYKVIGPNGNSIYLLAAGFRGCSGDVYFVGSCGYYWSSTPSDSDYAWGLYFNSNKVFMGGIGRCGGLSVRLVQ